MASGADRLSDLPDDLLIRILSFAPVKEAACTTALSRRWRHPLWLEADAINLDSRSYTRGDAGHARRNFLSHRRRLQKLTIIDRTTGNDHYWKFVKVVNSPLSLDALHILELSGCKPKQPRAGLPSLVALRLHQCSMELDDLQGLIHGAPKLDELRLEFFTFRRKFYRVLDTDLDPNKWRLLHCPSVSVLVTKKCDIDGPRIQLDAPRLRYFHYTEPSELRYVRWYNKTIHFDSSFALKNYAPSLERVLLEVPSTAPLPFILSPMCNTRFLKLTVDSLADIGEEAFSLFPRLERLEVQESDGREVDYMPATRAVVNLLKSCPAIQKVRFKLRPPSVWSNTKRRRYK